MTTINETIINNDPTLQRYSKELRNYKFFKCLGVGGFGAVYQVIHTIDSTISCIKVINLSTAPHNEKEKALQEVTNHSLLHHPNIIEYKTSFFIHNCL
jgi:serine/threonine protein kinase